MQMISLVLTVIADDRPGLVERLSSVIATHEGNWIESSMSRLAGAFAGIVRVEAEASRAAALEADLAALADDGIITTLKRGEASSERHGHPAHLAVICQDHPGIVHALSAMLAAKGVSITDLETEAYAGSMSGERMFRAEIDVVLPVDLEAGDLARALETLAGDMMAEIEFADAV
ncbi:glycine cleavage system transcriptional repressor [Stappia sp.]|jgi:glycine cleavage system regulatory protein|uniref:glycine cleavage system protein R n=1 Tax=Stappia sp. TaxID=1870903 RepID=UPI003A9A4E83